ncbi:MAG: hypothetical protein ACR2GR_09800 [Rhodothermales bacterium]
MPGSYRSEEGAGIVFVENLAKDSGEVEIVPQEAGRVLRNLLDYTATEAVRKQKQRFEENRVLAGPEHTAHETPAESIRDVEARGIFERRPTG